MNKQYPFSPEILPIFEKFLEQDIFEVDSMCIPLSILIQKTHQL